MLKLVFGYNAMLESTKCIAKIIKDRNLVCSFSFPSSLMDNVQLLEKYFRKKLIKYYTKEKGIEIQFVGYDRFFKE